MELRLSERACLITGASSGIGAGIARVLSKEGAKVAITGRRRQPLEQLALEIAAAGSVAPVVIVGDITDVQDLARVAESAVASMGRIDVLVNSAGGSRPLVDGGAEAVWQEAFALNFDAARRLTGALLPAMQAQRWGRIINLSGSMEPRSLNAATAAKAALHLWAKGLSCDVAADGVTVNCIAPGRINSEQTLNKLHPTDEARRSFIERHIPIGYFGEPEDVGHLVAFLASPLARYITGAVLPVDGGMHSFAH